MCYLRIYVRRKRHFWLPFDICFAKQELHRYHGLCCPGQWSWCSLQSLLPSVLLGAPSKEAHRKCKRRKGDFWLPFDICFANWRTQIPWPLLPWAVVLVLLKTSCCPRSWSGCLLLQKKPKGNIKMYYLRINSYTKTMASVALGLCLSALS